MVKMCVAALFHIFITTGLIVASQSATISIPAEDVEDTTPAEKKDHLSHIFNDCSNKSPNSIATFENPLTPPVSSTRNMEYSLLRMDPKVKELYVNPDKFIHHKINSMSSISSSLSGLIDLSNLDNPITPPDYTDEYTDSCEDIPWDVNSNDGALDLNFDITKDPTLLDDTECFLEDSASLSNTKNPTAPDDIQWLQVSALFPIWDIAAAKQIATRSCTSEEEALYSIFEWYAKGFIHLKIFENGIWAEISKERLQARISDAQLKILFLFKTQKYLTPDYIKQELPQYSKALIQKLCRELLQKNFLIKAQQKKIYYYLAEPFNRFFMSKEDKFLITQHRFTQTQILILKQFKTNWPVSIKKTFARTKIRLIDKKQALEALIYKGILKPFPTYYKSGIYYYSGDHFYLNDAYKKYLAFIE